MIKNPMALHFEHNALSETLLRFNEIAFASVFGSAKNGVVKEGSDLDIAIYLIDKEKDINLRLKIIESLEQILPNFDNYDLVMLNSANSILAMQAIQGKLLFIKPGFEDMYAGFYSITCRQFEDDTFWMKKQLEYRGYEVQWDN